jgi:hypothetical protein
MSSRIISSPTLADLTDILSKIEARGRKHDSRYQSLVYHALGLAKHLGIGAGIQVNVADPSCHVVFIEMPDDSELSWQLPSTLPVQEDE